MASDDRRLGSSGVFQAIVMSARRLKRALSDEDDLEVPPAADAISTQIAQAFVAGRFADVHALGTPGMRERTPADVFARTWRDTVTERGTLTGYEISNAGRIDLEYIPGLENVPQDRFVAFLEIVFSTPEVPLDQEKAFTIGVVLLDDGGSVRVGAIHAR